MTRAFQRIAIVNRGEAAVRFIRAVRDYNRERQTALVAIALYTDPDRQAPFVRLADEAYALGPALRHNATGALVSAYTDLDHLMRTLEQVRAEAVWPGWGFVAENASFVEMLENRDITFIGPPSAAMRRLGDKIAAKKVATAAKVPMAPWHLVNDGESLDVTETAATRIGYPLVVKASAGGGGRGIRVVKSADELAPSLASVADEVRRSFGGGGLFLESCVTAARHIEVQLVVGANGKGRTLGIRDCSIQRKHQKVIEEAPSPVVGGALSQRLQDAAVRLGEEVGYRGVGTVEFLVDPTRDFAHFLEVNTRLQVEHTVTELVTGVDLVQVQLDIARGLPWDELQPPEPTRGHAIEVRLNAEDPERNFTPSPGVVRVFKAPLGPGIRVDSGIAEGVAIAPEFDSMIAKLMAHGRDRGQAMARLLRALRELELVVEDGTSNKSFLVDLLQRPEVISGSADTGWLDRVGTIGPTPSEHPLSFEALCATAILVRREAIKKAAAGFHEDVQDGIPWPIKTAPSEGISLSLRGQSATFEAHALGADRFLVGPSGSLFFATFTARGPGQADLTLHTLAADGDLASHDGQAVARRHEVLFAHGKTGFAL
ncbi:MAG TPA: biotin carboxylase N-terminal domain-containing protein, partial [Myxococcota bacterium]|nr:biotin carboxylase N-terminal domain-containing protein [Myxococcota bacterium]